MTGPAIPDQCQGTVKGRWGYAGRCKRVGTVRVRGKLYCLTCARKVEGK